MKPTVKAGLLTAVKLFESKSPGKDLFRLLRGVRPPLLAGNFGNFEPLRNSFEKNSLDEALSHWEDPFLWNSRKPGVRGSVWEGTKSRHSAVLLTLATTCAPALELLQLVERVALRLSGVYGYLHFFSSTELSEEGRENINEVFEVCVTTHKLRKGIPDLTSVTILGAPYVELFGRERLLAAPVYEAKQIGEDLISLRLMKDPSASLADYAEFREVRERVKDYLGREAFWGPTGEPGNRIPDFGLKENPNIKTMEEIWDKILDT